MKAKRITKSNFATNLNSNDDVVPVRGLHYNQLKDDFDAHITGDGAGKFDTVSEYTSGEGVTADGVLLKDGLVGKVVSATATAGGTGEGILTGASQFVKVYSASANNIITLPAAATALIGAVIRGHTDATGCEIRTSATGTYVNNVNGDVESAIPADTTFKLELVTATDWILTTTDVSGAVQVVVPDAV